MTDRKRVPAARPVRVALIGCGEVCEHKHLPALRRVPGIQVVAVADPDEARRAHVADRFAIPHRFADVHAVIAAGVADAIGVLTPPALHAAAALPAIGAGLHVLVEKPLALDLDDADALVAAERTARGRILMGFHMRWHRLIRRAREAVQRGDIGAPDSIRISWNSPRGDGQAPEWKRRRVSGGGALVELGVHVFDLWRFVLGTPVAQVFAYARHGTRHDLCASIQARMEDGALASAVLSERTAHEIELEISGDRGRIRVGCQRFDGFEQFALGETNGMPGPRLRALAETIRELPLGLKLQKSLGDYGDSYRREWQHLVDCIQDGARPECTLADGHAALQVVIAASASADRGAPASIDASLRTIAPVRATQPA